MLAFVTHRKGSIVVEKSELRLFPALAQIDSEIYELERSQIIEMVSNDICSLLEHRVRPDSRQSSPLRASRSSPEPVDQLESY